MRILKESTHAIILARGGSKGIKHKNLLKIKNKPLVYWSIINSIKSKKIDHTWVSSDSNKILNISKKFGAKTIKRPKKFSGDKSSSEKAWAHAINYIGKTHNIKTVVGIQPTSPIRAQNDFDRALKIFKKNNFDSLFSSNRVYENNIWKYKNGKLFSNYNFRKNRKRRQDLKQNYLENGSFWIFNAKKFLKYKRRLFGSIGKYEMSKKCSFQIDDNIDLKIIKTLI